VKLVVDEYRETLDHVRTTRMEVAYKRDGREVIDYAVVLVAGMGATLETIRVFDSVHGFNEMHRYTRDGGKQTGKPFHSGTFGEGMRAAIRDIQDGYGEMIRGWER
jgi:hypothetical protein